MGWFSDDSDQAQAYAQVTQRPHEASWSHELIAGAAAFEAAKAYEDHVARNGQPDNHAMAKEIMAGFAGAFVDREVETKGLDFIDREKAKRHARQQAESAYFGNNGNNNYDNGYNNDGYNNGYNNDYNNNYNNNYNSGYSNDYNRGYNNNNDYNRGYGNNNNGY